MPTLITDHLKDTEAQGIDSQPFKFSEMDMFALEQRLKTYLT
jgi:hypothetical protein